MKKLYIVAGGSDGYVNIYYTFNQDAAEWWIDRDSDGDVWSDVEWLLVPDDFECDTGCIDEDYESFTEEENE